MNLHVALSSAALSGSPRLPSTTSPTAAPPALQPYASIRRWPRDQDILYQDGESEDWYCVISGAARQCILRPDGRRQIVDLLLPGDFFGFTPTGAQRFAVQAIVGDTIVASYPRCQIEAVSETDPRVASDIRARMCATIARLQEQLLIVGTMTAAEKVRSFLSYMLERLPSRPEEGITLPVSRYDIADQLGISVETVSRAFTELKSSGIITLGGPRTVAITADGVSR
jgi:CRP/FNR family transcriptional regulator, nitrogen fixation regulation protein